MSIATTEMPAMVEAGDVPYRITTDQFFHLIETGFFPREARVYLKDGEIFCKMSKTSTHGMVASLIAEKLNDRVKPGWFVITEGQFKLDPANSPLPDVAVVRGSQRDYMKPAGYPEAANMGLVVEVAITSLAKDLGPNLERHALALVPNYWVADVPGRRILVHTGPRVVDGKGEYGRVETIGPGGSVALVLDGREVGRFAYEDLMP